MKELIRTALPFFLAGTLLFASARNASGYAFNEIVPDVRMPAQLSGGSACPIPSRQPAGAGSIQLRWSTSLSANPLTILTQDQTANGRLNEIEQVIQQIARCVDKCERRNLETCFFCSTRAGRARDIVRIRENTVAKKQAPR